MHPMSLLFFFFNDTATTEIYTLSLHDALPISRPALRCQMPSGPRAASRAAAATPASPAPMARATRGRSEEHTSELQSRPHLVCRLLLEKKKLSTKTTARCPSRVQNCERSRLAP